MNTTTMRAPYTTFDYISRESQFYHKFEQHELKHLYQYCSETPWCAWWVPEELYQQIYTLTAPSKEALEEKITTVHTALSITIPPWIAQSRIHA